MKSNDEDEGRSFSETIIAIATLLTAVGGLITVMTTLPRPNIFFPARETATTALPKNVLATQAPSTEAPPISSSISWTIDIAGVCRDDKGDYPRWSEYSGWTLSQCQEACRNNPNCQGFAMSKEKNYCQLFGSDGRYGGSSPNAQITRGDSGYSQYTCYIKP